MGSLAGSRSGLGEGASGGSGSGHVRSSLLGAVLWLLCFQFFVAEQVARAHVRGPYSMVTDYISDLGAVHASLPRVGYSPLHGLMNGSFALQGVLIFSGAVLMRRLFAGGLLGKVACGFFLVSGAGLFAVGLAPEDVTPSVHFAGAAVHFVGGSLAMLVSGVALRLGDRRAYLGSGLTFMAGLVALAGTLLLAPPLSYLREEAGWPIGLVERVAAYPLPLWLTVTGFVLVWRELSRRRFDAQRVSI